MHSLDEMRRWILAATLLALALGGCGGAGVRALPPGAGDGIEAPESLLTSILREHVADGLVDYAALRHDDRLTEYLGYLSRTRPDTLPSPAHRLALWINAYNAWTLKVICDNYPVESIHELHSGGRIIGYLTRRTVWDHDLARVGGNSISLNDIEHGIIRERFDDPRIHFALVCAARSCPPLRAEAYSGERLDEQLDDQGRAFFAQTDKNSFDVSTKTAWLSKILDWYQGDFGEGDADVLRYVARYAPGPARASLQSHPDQWRLKHTDYDWQLNSR